MQPIMIIDYEHPVIGIPIMREGFVTGTGFLPPDPANAARPQTFGGDDA